MSCTSISLEQIIRSDRLPSLPQVAMRVIELARDSDVDFDEVARIIRSDLALSSRILKTVNSAIFGLGRHVDSIEQAIPLLGMTTVRTVVLGFSLAARKPGGRDLQIPLQKLWRSSLTQATVAELLAEETPAADPACYFLGGLLQDVGILAMLSTCPEIYVPQVLEISDFPNVAAAERRRFGFSHVEVSVAMCRRWGLPEELCDAIQTHHHRLETANHQRKQPLVVALQAAQLAAQYVTRLPRAADRDFDELAAFLVQRYDWRLEQVEELLRDTTFRVGEVAAMYRFDVGPGLPVERILDDAKRILEDLALRSQLTLMAEQRDKFKGHYPQQAAKLHDELIRDALTGVYNRRFLDRVLATELAKLVSGRQPVGCLFLDIDRFKSINDVHGHVVGDEAIQRIADALKQSVRSTDYVIRYGGDEFLVVIKNAAKDVLVRLAERCLRDFQHVRLTVAPEVEIRASIGGVHYQPRAGDPPNANWLIDMADQAMYEVKRHGGNQILIYAMSGCEVVGTCRELQLV